MPQETSSLTLNLLQELGSVCFSGMRSHSPGPQEGLLYMQMCESTDFKSELSQLQ